MSFNFKTSICIPSVSHDICGFPSFPLVLHTHTPRSCQSGEVLTIMIMHLTVGSLTSQPLRSQPSPYVHSSWAGYHWRMPWCTAHQMSSLLNLNFFKCLQSLLIVTLRFPLHKQADTAVASGCHTDRETLGHQNKPGKNIPVHTNIKSRSLAGTLYRMHQAKTFVNIFRKIFEKNLTAIIRETPQPATTPF